MSTQRLSQFKYERKGSVTFLHDGTNAAGQPPVTTKGFIIQAELDTNVNGYHIKKGATINATGFLSRGTNSGYQLDKISYMGGPFTLIIEKDFN